jgi:uncharacterized C2H2 Zn-finger protein
MAIEKAVVSEGAFSKARLHNEGREVYDQEVNGERYVIQPGEYIEVPRRVAVAIRGHFPGRNTACSLRLEPVAGKRDLEKIDMPEAERVYVCPKCDAEFDDKDEYADHYDKEHKRVRGKPAQRTAETVTAE